MKAFLKEKRIGLRSLWRRGLVILSLFALVFSSCDDTSGGGSSAPSGKVPLEIRVKTQPQKQNYEGMPVDISGIEVEARYAGSNPLLWVPVTDLSPYGVYPKFVEGTNDGKDATVKDRYYFYSTGDGTLVRTLIEVKVSNLIRSRNDVVATPDGNPYKPNPDHGDNQDFWGQGVQIYAPEGGYTSEYYVDDFPNFNGIHVQGHYKDGSLKDIPLTQDLRWEIRPNYKKAPDTGSGDLVITIGGPTGYSEWGANSIGGYAPPWENTGAGSTKGVEVSVPLTKVYHITDVKVKTPPPFEGIFYWEEDSSSKWLSASGRDGYVKDAELEVTYSDGETRTINMVDAVRLNTVWYNANPINNERPIAVRGIYDTVKYENKQSQLSDTWPNLKGKTAPQITFYYRGYKVPYDVYVFNRLTGITATPKAGVATPIVADMTFPDNDNVGKNAKWFAEQIDVVATFSASSDSTKTRTLPLKYEETPKVAGNPDQALANAQQGKELEDKSGGTYTNWVAAYGKDPSDTTYRGGPNLYSMDFGTPDWKWFAGEKVYKLGDDAWGVSATAKNGATKKVTIYYTPGVGTRYDPDGTPKQLFNDRTRGGDIPGVKKASVDVQWKNIPGAQ